MSGFHDVRLSIALAIGSAGGPERSTEIVRLASGREQRNARWAGSRRRWEIGGGVLRADQAYELVSFFEARRGRQFGFRFRDPVDWKSCAPSAAISPVDQVLGPGNGETRSFALAKRYGGGEAEWIRPIPKPVAGRVRLAVDGAETLAFALDAVAGVVTFDAPPPEGAVVTGGFEFDIPVRFDADRIETVMEGADAVRVGRLSVVEIEPA